MNFSQALEKVKAGAKISRSNWNAGGQFVYYVPAASYPASTKIAMKEFADTTTPAGVQPMVPYGAYLAIKTVQGNVVPWLASQTDLLSDDWQAEEEDK